MIHAYNKIYLEQVQRNLANLIDIAINIKGIGAADFETLFAESEVAHGIENAVPNMLAGKSACEMIALLTNDEPVEYLLGEDRSKEYWAGWILAKFQWMTRMSFKEIFSHISLSTIIDMYSPFHEAPEEKALDELTKRMPKMESKLKTIRMAKGITQESLAFMSEVNLRSIRAYEQNRAKLMSASGETLYKLARILGCSMEELME